jgi:hypothetical protein
MPHPTLIFVSIRQGLQDVMAAGEDLRKEEQMMNGEKSEWIRNPLHEHDSPFPEFASKVLQDMGAHDTLLGRSWASARNLTQVFSTRFFRHPDDIGVD